MPHAFRCLVGALGLLCGAAALADETPGTESSRDAIFSVVFENDLFANLDQHYTNGVRFSYLSRINQVPEFVGR